MMGQQHDSTRQNAQDVASVPDDAHAQCEIHDQSSSGGDLPHAEGLPSTHGQDESEELKCLDEVTSLFQTRRESELLPPDVAPSEKRDSAGSPSLSPADAKDETSITKTAPLEPPPTAINDLRPGLLHWCLYARVISRTPVREWENFYTKGKLVELFLADAAGSHIRATFFDAAADKFDAMLKTGNEYSFAQGKIKPAFGSNSSTTARFDVTFNEEAVVHALPAGAVPAAPLNITCTTIADLGSLASTVGANVIGILLDVAAMKRLKSKKGKTLIKRDVILAGESVTKVICTLWGQHARDDLGPMIGHPFLVIGAQISDYSGTRSISIGAGATVMITPDLPRAKELSVWFDTIADKSAFLRLQSTAN
ncbi:hypothetical protein BBJ28_00002470 [Nothophytophthora sp. Chile5]|nr:hypothetical protein BBJ28_00002470 [Nothophytophthora sp. Chile5]